MVFCDTVFKLEHFYCIYKPDIKGLVDDFYRPSNAVIANLNLGDSQTLDRLHSVLCFITFNYLILTSNTYRC